MILKNISVLYGNDLKFIEKTNVQVAGDTFQKISPKTKPTKNKFVDCNGLLLIPGFINSHTLIGDSVAKDIALNKGVDSKIHPVFGVKQKILRAIGPRMYLILMFFISAKFDLFKKKGQVAPKCGSARINSVAKIKIFSY